MGDSAGGNLAITFTQYLRLSNSSNLPYPKSSILISPWVKLIAETYQNTPGHSYYNYSSGDVTQYDTLSGAEVYQHILGTETKLNSLTVSQVIVHMIPKIGKIFQLIINQVILCLYSLENMKLSVMIF